MGIDKKNRCQKFISESRAKLFCAVTRDSVSENNLVQRVPRGSGLGRRVGGRKG